MPQRKGDPVVVDTDEGVRPETTVESLAGLRPAFDEEGTVTAGNASQISDGAAAVVVMSPERADELGLSPLGEIVGYGQVAGPDASLLTQPSHAIKDAVARAGLGLGDVDLFEISEAFAAVSAASIDDLGVPDDIVNVNGGAIALGHPIGMSGTRLALTMLYELRRRGGGLGAVGALRRWRPGRRAPSSARSPERRRGLVPRALRRRPPGSAPATGGGTQPLTSRRPSRARPSVSSSAYSRSPPTGSPLAIRVTFTPSGSSSRARYIAVASPSRLGFVHKITSATPSRPSRTSSGRTRSCSGPTPSMGLSAPPSTW